MNKLIVISVALLSVSLYGADEPIYSSTGLEGWGKEGGVSIVIEDYSQLDKNSHAFSLTLKDPSFDYSKLYSFLEGEGIQCKRNFGSMPTQHEAFKYLGHKLGEFPEAEYVGNNGLHFGIHQFLSKDDLDFASDKLHKYFGRK